jgi:competence protein ComEC
MNEHFLDMIKPQVGVISVGQRNHYRHPTDKALGQLSRIGTTVYRTDRDARIQVKVNDAGFSPKKSK